MYALLWPIVMRHRWGSATICSEVSSVPYNKMQVMGAISILPRQCWPLFIRTKHRGGLKIWISSWLETWSIRPGRFIPWYADVEMNATFNFILLLESLEMPDELSFTSIYMINIMSNWFHRIIISKAEYNLYDRVQKERFSDPMEYEKARMYTYWENFKCSKPTKAKLCVFSFLPRVDEIHPTVDSNQSVLIWNQAPKCFIKTR